MEGDRANGALVLSLDFELYWGMRDRKPLDAAERQRLLRAREVVPQILSVFREHSIRATWATVGLLFARSRDEAEEYRPPHVPQYEQRQLDPYAEMLGADEATDPFHFAPSLIKQVAETPGQEVASHSFSHYYALERGPGEREFQADLNSAIRIAANSGHFLKSYVFPRNQVRGSYLPILKQAGFESYRGTEPAKAHPPVSFREQRRLSKRAFRLADAYWNLNGMKTVAWPRTDCSRTERPVSVSASRYLRPYSSALSFLENERYKRIESAMRSAARERRIFHLWWHPEDFAAAPERNLDFLERVLTAFGRYRRELEMVSLSMRDVGALVRTEDEEDATRDEIVESVQ